MSDTAIKNAKLAEAANALIEAASLEADAMTQKKLTANLDSLKLSFADSLNRVVNKMQSSNENFDAKMNTLNQHVSNLSLHVLNIRIDILALKTTLEDEKKQKTFERALGLTDLNSFAYFEHKNRSYHGEEKNSSELAKVVIKWFMLGYGYNLSSSATVERYYKNGNTTEEEALNKIFIDKFAAQIKILIKREPRLEKKETGIYTIFYE